MTRATAIISTLMASSLIALSACQREPDAYQPIKFEYMKRQEFVDKQVILEGIPVEGSINGRFAIAGGPGNRFEVSIERGSESHQIAKKIVGRYPEAKTKLVQAAKTNRPVKVYGLIRDDSFLIGDFVVFHGEDTAYDITR